MLKACRTRCLSEDYLLFGCLFLIARRVRIVHVQAAAPEDSAADWIGLTWRILHLLTTDESRGTQTAKTFSMLSTTSSQNQCGTIFAAKQSPALKGDGGTVNCRVTGNENVEPGYFCSICTECVETVVLAAKSITCLFTGTQTGRDEGNVSSRFQRMRTGALTRIISPRV